MYEEKMSEVKMSEGKMSEIQTKCQVKKQCRGKNWCRYNISALYHTKCRDVSYWASLLYFINDCVLLRTCPEGNKMWKVKFETYIL